MNQGSVFQYQAFFDMLDQNIASIEAGLAAMEAELAVLQEALQRTPADSSHQVVHVGGSWWVQTSKADVRDIISRKKQAFDAEKKQKVEQLDLLRQKREAFQSLMDMGNGDLETGETAPASLADITEEWATLPAMMQEEASVYMTGKPRPRIGVPHYTKVIDSVKQPVSAEDAALLARLRELELEELQQC